MDKDMLNILARTMTYAAEHDAFAVVSAPISKPKKRGLLNLLLRWFLR